MKLKGASHVETLKQAREIRRKREQELIANQYGLIAPYKADEDFYSLLKSYESKSDYRLFAAVVAKLKKHAGKEVLPCKSITRQVCEGSPE